MAFLTKWYYFRHFFGFSCSGYDLTLIIKSHTLNCYWFLLKFLSKVKTYKLVVGNCAQFIVKSTNSERPIYFLSLMSCSTNKLKFHMLFTCKNFKFSDLTWEKNICSRNWWGGGLALPPCPPLSLRSCIYLSMLDFNGLRKFNNKITTYRSI